MLGKKISCLTFIYLILLLPCLRANKGTQLELQHFSFCAFCVFAFSIATCGSFRSGVCLLMELPYQYLHLRPLRLCCGDVVSSASFYSQRTHYCLFCVLALHSFSGRSLHHKKGAKSDRRFSLLIR